MPGQRARGAVASKLRHRSHGGRMFIARRAPLALAALLVIDHYLDYEQVSDPQISPDGSQIVYTRRWVNKLEDKWESVLWIVRADGSRNRFLVKGAGAIWSPDGTRI